MVSDSVTQHLVGLALLVHVIVTCNSRTYYCDFHFSFELHMVLVLLLLSTFALDDTLPVLIASSTPFCVCPSRLCFKFTIYLPPSPIPFLSHRAGNFNTLWERRMSFEQRRELMCIE